MSLTRLCGAVPATSNELIPQNEVAQFSTRAVFNPVGLPANAQPYLLLTANLTQGDPDVVQFAIDPAGLLWTRRSIALPSTWSAWAPAGAAVGAVTSWNGRVGAVVPLAGDYTAAQVTFVPFGYVANTDTQAAINAIITQTAPVTTIPGVGIMVQISPNAFVVRSLVAGSGILLVNTNGVAGNPTISVSLGLAALDALAGGAGTGLVVQTGVNTFADRSLNAGAGIAITNPDGVAGNPSVAVSAGLAALSALAGAAGTGYVVQTGVNTFVDRSLVAGAGIAITNPDGVAGPTVITNTAVGSGVTSFNGRTGAVISVAGDYAENQITNVPFGYVSAVDGQSAINQIITMTTPITSVAGTGIVVQTAANTFVTRSIVSGAGIVVTNGSGVAANPSVAVSAGLSALDTLAAGAGTGYVVQTGVNTFVDRTFAAGAGITLTNASGVAGNTTIAVTGGPFIPSPAPANLNDALLFDGANWVSSTTQATGRINNLRTNTLIEQTLNTPITGAVGLNLTGSATAVPMYQFSTGTVSAAVNTSAFNIVQTNAAFNQPLASVLRVDAPNSTSLGGGTKFISCTNNAAAAAPYTNRVVFAVDSAGNVFGLSFNLWSSEGYKKDITNVNLDSKALRNMRACSYRYMAESQSNPKRAGIMYEDVESILPEAVTETTPSGKSVDVSGMFATLVGLMKDLEARITKSESDILGITISNPAHL